jgi:hypothetical protein
MKGVDMSAKQRRMDAARQIFSIAFPEDPNDARIKAWLGSLSSTLEADISRMVAMPSLVFETIGDDLGITHHLRVPRHDLRFVTSHAESLIPGTRLEKHELVERDWTVGTELHMTNKDRPLSIPEGLSDSILTTLQSLRENETVIIQWVVGNLPKYQKRPAQHPANHQQPAKTTEFNVWRSLWGRTDASPDEIEMRRKKLDQPNMIAVCRVAVRAPHPLRAKELQRDTIKAIRAAGSGSNHFVERHISARLLNERINMAATPYLFPCQVTLDELIPLINWPGKDTYVAGIQRSRTRTMHVTNMVPRAGDGVTVIGRSTDESKRDVGIRILDRTQHCQMLGPTRSGKTYELASIAEQDMKDGLPVIVIETKHELYDLILQRVPPERWNDVIIWDPTDPDFALGFNIFEQSDPSSVAMDVNTMINTMFPESGPMTTGPLFHAIKAMYEAGYTFIDIAVFVRPQTDEEKAWRDKVIASLKPGQVKRYWEYQVKLEKKAGNSNAGDPLLRRLWQFSSRDEIRRTLGQSKSSFLIRDIIMQKKILLINADSSKLGDGAALLCTMFLNAVWNVVRERIADPKNPTVLYLDEFQNFLRMPTNPSDMLAQSAAYGMVMMLSHQNLDQIHDRELQAAVLANARSKIIFQLTGKDAGTLAREFGTKVKPEDFMNLDKREAIARVATEFGVSQPFTMRTKDISRPCSNPYDLIKMSRERYGRPIHEVDAEIDARTSPPRRLEPRPPAGDQPYDPDEE